MSLQERFKSLKATAIIEEDEQVKPKEIIKNKKKIFSIIKIDHDTDRLNEKIRIEGGKDYVPIATIIHQCDEEEKAIVYLNNCVNSLADENLTLERHIKSNHIIQVLDRTSGVFRKSNTLLYTFMILS